MRKPARILVIAGSDSGGGAGIQADIKTISALGGFATTAITAITAQNTLGVQAVEPVSPSMIAAQINSVLSDIGTDAIKTGMLFSSEIIEAILPSLSNCPVPLVLDPVMVAKGGAPLLQAEAVQKLKDQLFPHAALITPNIPEAEFLTGQKIASQADMIHAASQFTKWGGKAVLIKGGHGAGDMIQDLLWVEGKALWFENPRILSNHTHGTGCTLASAIACFLAQGIELSNAVEKAIAYVRQAITHAPGFGAGAGPLWHFNILS